MERNMNLKNLLSKSKNIDVLYVEDDKNIRNDTHEVLNDIFLSVDSEKDGVEGFNKYMQYHKDNQKFYDLVISDIKMPNKNGITLCKDIFKINSSQIIIIISAHNDSEYLVELINLGISHFIQKPLELNNAFKVFHTTSSAIYSTRLIEEYNKKIKTMNHELKQLNEDLELRVKERTRELENQLYFDKLTRVLSYSALLRDIKKSDYSTIFLINIDSFQNINNIYGFQSGNTILKQFALCLKGFGNIYKIYRTHADEFVLLKSTEIFNLADFENELQKMKEKIQNFKFKLEDGEYIDVDATIGVSISSDNPLATAHMALKYANKHRLGYKIYNKDIDITHKMNDVLKWSAKIKNAIKNDMVFPVFQPIVNKNKEIVKYEVLMRISEVKDDKIDMISPYFFLDAAIKTKQYNTLSNIIIEKSFQVMNNNDKDFSINISYEDIFNHTLIKYLKINLEKYPDIGDRLIIEILETELIEDMHVMNSFISEFKKYGVRIAIDDFGTGHSNFSNILDLNPDYIKIDGSFIKNIHTDKKSYSLVKGIIESAKELNIKTIAEFIHSKDVFDVTLKLGIDEFQGFYFSEPLLKP